MGGGMGHEGPVRGGGGVVGVGESCECQGARDGEGREERRETGHARRCGVGKPPCAHSGKGLAQPIHLSLQPSISDL